MYRADRNFEISRKIASILTKISQKYENMQEQRFTFFIHSNSNYIMYINVFVKSIYMNSAQPPHPQSTFLPVKIFIGKGSLRYEKFNMNKKSNRSNSMQICIHCKATLHVSGVTAPIIRSIKNYTRSLRYRSYYLYRTRLAQTSPDQTTLEGCSGTSSMTCTGGCGYSF